MNKTSRKAFKFRLNLTQETNQKLVMYAECSAQRHNQNIATG
ncbi:MAG: hypothetical protein NTW85_07875 [Methylococcales bacterium]|nr:hypothetical protein [Methylococcales bacterium]